MTEFNKIKIMAKTSAAFWIAFFLSLSESFFTYLVFVRTSELPEPFNHIQAVLIALFIDLAVLYFSVTGQKKLSVFYWIAMTGFVILAAIPEADKYYITLVWEAMMLPSAVYFFSHTIIVKEIEKKAIQPKQEKPKVRIPKDERVTEVLKFHRQGLSLRDIGRRLNIGHATVDRIIKNQ